MLKIHRSLMDTTVNSLHDQLVGQKLLIASSLAMMWTAIACAAIGAWFWYGELVVSHALVVLGCVVTGITFQNAGGAQLLPVGTRRAHPARDGTSRYDDARGA